MAFAEFSYFSKALKTTVNVNVILPEVSHKEETAGKPAETYKTLYLYHGLGGDYREWMRETSIARYADAYKIAVVMPSAGRSWYTDTVREEAYFTYLTRELPEVCRGYFKGMSDKREDNFVGGLSMGGYGAMKAALYCPDAFCGCATLSGSLDITRRRVKPLSLMEWRAIFGYGLKDPLELEGTEHDLYAAAKRNREAGIPFPRIYMWAGTEDSQLKPNQDFHALLNDLGVEHLYQESEGDHSWKWWDLHIRDALAYLFSDGSAC